MYICRGSAGRPEAPLPLGGGSGPLDPGLRGPETPPGGGFRSTADPEAGFQVHRRGRKRFPHPKLFRNLFFIRFGVQAPSRNGLPIDLATRYET